MRTLWVLILFGSLIIHHCFTTATGEAVPSDKAQAQPSFSECKTYVDAALKGEIPAEPPIAEAGSSSSAPAAAPPPDEDDDEDDEPAQVTNEPEDADDDDDDSHEQEAVAHEADDSSEETEAVEAKDHDNDDSSEEEDAKDHGEVHDDDDDSSEEKDDAGAGEAGKEEEDDDSSSEEEATPEPEPAKKASTKKTKAEAPKPDSEESEEDGDDHTPAAPEAKSTKDKRDAEVSSPVADDSDESDESGSHEEEAQKTQAAKESKAKPAVKAEAPSAPEAAADDDDDSSEEVEVEPPVVKAASKKETQAKPKKVVEEKEDDDDDDSSEEVEEAKPKASQKKGKQAKKTAVVEEDDDDDDDSSEEEVKAKPAKSSKKPAKAAKKPAVVEEDDDDDDESSEEVVEVVKSSKKTSKAKETKKPAVQEDDESDEDDSSEEEQEPVKASKGKKDKPAKKAAVAEDDDDDSDEDSDEDDSDEEEEESYKPRSRSHINRILGLQDNDDKKQKYGLLDKVTTQTLKELKSTYEYSIKPLETMYKYRDLSNRHFGDPEIFSKPMIVFMGPWSGGKSTIINWLLGIQEEEHALRTGADPSPAQFNIMIHGDEDEVLDGTQLAADWTFSGLQKFGQAFLDRLRGRKLPNRLLEKVNLVEIPGILEIRKQVERSFPFNDACQWFIDRADVLFLVYDPAKLDIGPETEAILDQLKGRENQVRIVLNKADSVTPDELLRVQATLIWNISPLMASAEPPVLYAASLWDRPLQSQSPVSLLTAHENLFLKDIAGATEKRVETRIAAARRFAVRVRNHAKMCDCYLTTYNNHRSFFSNKKRVSDDIIDHPQNYHIYEGLSTLTNISRYDLPDPDTYKDFFRLNPMWEFPTLASTCTYFRGCPINKLDIAIAYDLPELLGRYRRQRESILTSPVGTLPTIQFKDIPKPPEDKPAGVPKNKWYKDPQEPAAAPAPAPAAVEPPAPEPAKPEEKVKGKKKSKKAEPEPEKPVETVKAKSGKSKEEPKKEAKPAAAAPASTEPMNEGKKRWWKPYVEPDKPDKKDEEPVNIGKQRWWKPYTEPEKPDKPESEEPVNIGKARWWKPYKEPEKKPEAEEAKPKNKWYKS